MSRKGTPLAPVDLAKIVEALDESLDAKIADVLTLAECASLAATPADDLVYDLLRYHLGYLNVDLAPERVDPGKRMRSKLCAFSCLASDGSIEDAVPAAAAIELLHNFTLIHDDIQDRSLLRRHRPTLWSRWGDAQAINAGDAMFVLAHLALNSLAEAGTDAATVLEISTTMHAMTLRIVEGQVLDLGYERRDDVRPSEYLTMIGGKTAAICRFAAWAGARVAGADSDRAEQFGQFGQALGIGFQLRDDLLGIWGAAEATGKDAGDIRRKKKSYPVMLLFERAEAEDRAVLQHLYRADELDDTAVATVMRQLDVHDIRQAVESEASRWHSQAASALRGALPAPPGAGLLSGLLAQLDGRVS